MSSTAPRATLAPQNPATVLLLLIRDVLAPAVALALVAALILAAVLSMTIVSVSMLTTPAQASVVQAPPAPADVESVARATPPFAGSRVATAGLMLVGFTVVRALAGVLEVRGQRSGA